MTEQIARYYDDNYDAFGNSVSSLGWYNKDTQFSRFDALATIDNLSDKRILDVGCGLGNLYEYLNEYYKDVDYLGIDISTKILNQARVNFSDATFIKSDLLGFKPDCIFDYIFASGTFNIKVNDNYHYLDEMIKKMWELAKEGIAFNLLSAYAPDEHQDPFFFFYQPDVVLKLCLQYTSNVVFRHDYLVNDMTFVMKK
jgi:trans-aconitate methyltransferase